MVHRNPPALHAESAAEPTAEDGGTDRYRAPALDKGLDILELLSATEAGLTQAEIAKALDRSPNEIYRMLDRLVRRGYIARTDADRYELSLKLFALAHHHPPLRRLVAQATPLLRGLAQDAGQSCHLAVYERGRVVVVAQFDAPSYWGLAIRTGARIALLGTGSGHVLLAFQSVQERRFMLAEHETLAGEGPPPDDLEQRLAAIRARGHEIMPSRQTRGVLNISAPILAPDGAALAAVSCPYVGRIDDATAPDAAQVARLIMRVGQSLSPVSGGRAKQAPRA